MASTATTRLRLDKQATGDNPNAWGLRLNTALDLIDEAVAGVQTVTVGSNLTLTSNNYASDQSRKFVLRFVGAGGFTVTVPSVEKAWLIDNRCSAAVTLKTDLAAGVSLRAGITRMVYSDGSSLFVDDSQDAADAAADAVAAAQSAQASAAAAQTWNPANYYTITATDAAIANALAGAVQLVDFRTALIEIAKLKGDQVGMVAGVADDFKDQDGVDAAGSTNENYNANLFAFENYAVTVEPPNMTSNSAPAGYVASASSTSAGAPFNAFTDADTGGSWAPSTVPATIALQHPLSQMCTAYSITGAGSNYPTAWTLEGSNNGTTWTTLDTRTGQSPSSVTTFAVSPANWLGFTYHRLNISAINGNGLIGLLRFNMKSASAAMDLRSVAFTAASAPTKASLWIMAQAIGLTALTANTTVTGYASRDSGTTWTTFTLAQKGTLTTGEAIFEANDLNISGQPSGTALKWRIVTPSTVDARIGAVVFQWR